MKRLEFFIDGKAIGCFLSGDYPSHPGRYRYEPYRGEGHAALVASLQKGATIVCSFSSDGAGSSIVIAQEIFVPATPDSYWFVDITKIEVQNGTPVASCRSALAPITCRGIT